MKGEEGAHLGLKDCYAFCINLIKEQNEAGRFNISISSSSENKLLPAVKKSSRILVLPKVSEGLLILDEIGAQKDFVNLMMAQKMLQYDRYDQCFSFIEELEKNRENLVYQKNDQLFISVLIKQVFFVLHEYGHLFVGDNETIRDGLCKRIDAIIEAFGEEIVDSSSAKNQYETLKELYPDRKDEFDYFSPYIYPNMEQNKIYDMAKIFAEKERKKEEYIADTFAIFEIESLFSYMGVLNSSENVCLLGKKILETLCITHYINLISKTLDREYISPTENKEKWNKVYNTEMDMIIYNVVRLIVGVYNYSSIIQEKYKINEFFDLQYIERLNVNKARILIDMKNEDNYESINKIISEGSGDNKRDENTIFQLNNKIEDYVQSLKQLYA